MYIKEVATNGGDQSVLSTKGFEINNSTNIETYLDNAKIENKNIDNTVAPTILPKAGITSLMIFTVIVVISGVVVYSKYRKLRDIK